MIEDLEGDELAGLRVLIVDDEPETLELIAFALRAAGADVMEASGVTSALSLLAATTRNPDVIVSDLQMPDRDGFELMRNLKERGVAIAAIALSASASLTDPRRALEAGFRVHVAKPIAIADLIAAIRAIAPADKL